MGNDMTIYTTGGAQHYWMLREWEGGHVRLTSLPCDHATGRAFATTIAKFGFDGTVNSDNNSLTTHPLQGHSVDFCLGRKDRLRAVFSFLA